jgi:hypothetical protein
MLISMPTGTSTIFGVFQDIWVSFKAGRFSPSPHNLMRLQNFASILFTCCSAKTSGISYAGAGKRLRAQKLPVTWRGAGPNLLDKSQLKFM